ncbi:hypothetical protein JCM5350_004808 [Sporobolomyces pararoseus]
MTSIASLIGLDRTNIAQTAATLSSQARVHPEDYPLFAQDAKRLDQDIRIAYAEALSEKQEQERIQDRHFLERAKEFVELNEQVEASTQLLTELASFLSTFQTDLSAVSGHISELQGRSKTIEGRLEARKAVQRSLQPFLESITISPGLISTILDTPVSPSWIPAIIELDQKLGAIRGGARVESRKPLDQASEGLRLAATTKISNHLNSLVRPYTTSLSSLSPLHSSLLTYKALFDFLRRHSARQAHEFQKNYTNTVRWYHETAFRRYVRSLEGLRTRTSTVGGNGFKWEELVSTGNEGQASLALLNAKRRGGGTPVIPSSQAETGLNVSESSRSAIFNSRLGLTPPSGEEEAEEEIPVITAWQSNDKNLKPTYERLFRSISIVLAHNSSREYQFLDAFFGVHSSLPTHAPPAATPGARSPLGGGLGRMRRLDSNGSISAFSSSVRGGLPVVGESENGGGDDQQSESGKTVTSTFARSNNQEESEKMRKVLVESLWKSVMEPALEYSYNFIHALLTPPSSPSPLSLISMIRLNNTILSFTSSVESSLPCPPLESHLYSIRLLLWPLLTKILDAQIESLKKINGSPSSTASSGVGGLLGRMAGTGGGGASVKDSTVQAILERYVEWFVTIVEICSKKRDGDGDVEVSSQEMAEDEPVFQLLLRLRTELDRLLVHQSQKIPDPAKQRAFLRAGYQELVTGLSMGFTRHERVQMEIAHYRELGRTVQ